MAYNKACQDIYDKVHARVKAEGGNALKAFRFATVAAENCMKAGGGDPPDKKDK